MTDHRELETISSRMEQVMYLLDSREMRWLELSERV